MNSNLLLDVVGVAAILSAIFIIIVANPMYSILFLIFLFINVALYLYMIGISIMSLLYLLVYVGAIAVLFLFILSLLDINYTELNYSINNNNYPLIVLITYFLYNHVARYYNSIYDYYVLDKDTTETSTGANSPDYNLSAVFENNWYNAVDFNHLNQIGYLLYTEYSILFIILSFLLLFSIVSAIVLTLNK